LLGSDRPLLTFGDDLEGVAFTASVDAPDLCAAESVDLLVSEIVAELIADLRLLDRTPRSSSQHSFRTGTDFQG
jgi:hypothetical protein